jgi:hypothetical protein
LIYSKILSPDETTLKPSMITHLRRLRPLSLLILSIGGQITMTHLPIVRIIDFDQLRIIYLPHVNIGFLPEILTIYPNSLFTLLKNLTDRYHFVHCHLR